MARPDGRQERMVIDDLQRALVALPRPNPFVVGWRWRYELLLLSGGAALAIAAIAAIGPWWTGSLVVGAAAVVGSTPALRRALTARVMVIVTPHRIRLGCKHAWVHNRSGKLPAVLYTSARAYGERVTLWCPPGIATEDLAMAADVLAAACWAARVEVEPHPRRAQLAILHVIRTEPARPAAPSAD
jgi:hypothetical protein